MVHKNTSRGHLAFRGSKLLKTRYSCLASRSRRVRPSQVSPFMLGATSIPTWDTFGDTSGTPLGLSRGHLGDTWQNQRDTSPTAKVSPRCPQRCPNQQEAYR